MKTIISIAGRGASTTYLAQQLLKRNSLEKLITSYPKFEIVKYGIPRSKIDSVIIKEILTRGWSKLPNFIKNVTSPDYFIHETFDKGAAKRITPADIFWGWTSFSLHSLREAQKKGAISIIEVGNAPMLEQNRLLKDEYDLVGWPTKSYELSSPRLVEKAIQEYKETDYLSVPSLYIKNRFLAFGIPEERIIHIPYGVDLSAFRQVPKEDKIFRVIFAGGMSLRKGVHYLIQAFTELKLPNSELFLVGGLTEQIKPIFKKYEGHYTWVGHKPQAELYKLYSQGSVFAFPSLDDGFGAVLVQAMACGLPAIASTNTGGPDIIEEGKEGFIIPIKDVEALKEKILFFYKNPQAVVAMGQAAKQRVTSGLTWDDYGDKVFAAFEKIMAAKKQ
ncbi:MAG: glycosyltransferase family 4 protein [Patescibacteria group bacterium]